MRRILNWSMTVLSLLGCIFLSFNTLPGMNLFGITPNWLLIYLVAWSVKHSLVESAIAGLVMGSILDGLTAPERSHIVPFVVAAVVTVLIHRRIIKKMQENFISLALIVFGMVILVEALQGLQFLSTHGTQQALGLTEFWVYQQRAALSSAILSSLWTPVLCLPLHYLWEQVEPPRRPDYSGASIK
ncbi:MAG: rod shape-determining protein MreD [Oscillatoriales cyanobacterium RM1_1_9]|nr:rod shape-determining protein MreD [Oscillatoriales cyanobacterium SM2_3_0]NJO70667.1 rod shape-determining protein MreD [Oscillatoriales cyanobacterium RM1_1_9]